MRQPSTFSSYTQPSRWRGGRTSAHGVGLARASSSRRSPTPLPIHAQIGFNAQRSDSMADRLLLRDAMRCRACGKAIGLDDSVNELPIAGALVHRVCYEWETGQPSHWAPNLARAPDADIDNQVASSGLTSPFLRGPATGGLPLLGVGCPSPRCKSCLEIARPHNSSFTLGMDIETRLVAHRSCRAVRRLHSAFGRYIARRCQRHHSGRPARDASLELRGDLRVVPRAERCGAQTRLKVDVTASVPHADIFATVLRTASTNASMSTGLMSTSANPRRVNSSKR
jgi:hypothetical protein